MEDPKAAALERSKARAASSSKLQGSCPLYESVAKAVFVDKITDIQAIAKAIGDNEHDLWRNLHSLPKEEQEALIEGGVKLY